MKKIYSPNKLFNGEVAKVKFVNGVGETDFPYLLDYFKRKGYTIEDVKKKPKGNKQVKDNGGTSKGK
ncbi:hypothetical protein [Bacillus sp. SM2101]|uniref:hypothetical protein n=1 Tax=Bacillus sp. SM2101 TaxID=2805366 RepID=UPI001BDF1ACC|nr:hypothetical protein [Bacillus sp. SM2101]